MEPRTDLSGGRMSDDLDARVEMAMALVHVIDHSLVSEDVDHDDIRELHGIYRRARALVQSPATLAKDARAMEVK